MRKSLWALLLLAFYLSGTCGLLYEIIWVRMFSLVFGNTNYAATIVLSAFFVGMAFGSLFFGKKSDGIGRPLRLYGILEVGIGLSAALVPYLINVMDNFYPHLYRQLGEGNPLFLVVRFVLSFGIVFVPTFLMGGTLPLVIRFTGMLKEEFGKSVSLLYAVNTFGGVTGCFLAGFFLVRLIGIHNTILVGAGMNILVGIAAVIVSRRYQGIAPSPQELRPKADAETSPVSEHQTRLARKLLFIAFFTGVFSLAFEVVWARLLVYILSSSVYAFNIMLTTFLFGIGLGSFLAKRIIRRCKSLVNLCGFFLWCTGLYGFLTIPLLVFLAVKDEAIMSMIGLGSWAGYSTGRFIESAVILLLPTVMMGIVFPLIASMIKSEQTSGSRVIGNVYFVNTLGAIGGAILGGFVLIPFLGCKWSILLLSSAYVGMGMFVLVQSTQGTIVRYGSVIVSGLLIIISIIALRGNPFIPLFNIREQGSEITYIREGITGTVTVHQHRDYRVINVNRVNVAGTSFVLRTTQKLQAFLPLLVAKDPRLVCQIGFGSGETSSIVVRYESVERLDVVDISYEVFDAAPQFHDINHGVYRSDKVKKIVMDGKNYMHLTDEMYDLIMNDSIHPVECGNASLYTKEYFEDCRRRLREGGIMSSWFPLFALDERDFKALVNTFNTVFPGSTLWIGNNCVNRHGVLIGRKDGKEVEVDFSFVQEAVQRPWIARELAEIRMYTVYDVIDSFMLNGEAIAGYTHNADINTDVYPVLEYRSPMTLLTDPILLAGNINDMFEIRSNVYDSLINIPPDQQSEVRAVLDLYMKSTAFIYQGHISDILEEYGNVVPNYQRAAEVNPYDRDGIFLVEDIKNRERFLSEKLDSGKATQVDLISLSVLRIKLGRLQDATHSLEAALKHDGRNLSLLYGLYSLYQRLQDAENQARIIDLLLQFDKNPEVYFQKGILLGRGGNLEEANEYFEKSVRLNQHSARYNFYLALSYQSLGDKALRSDDELYFYRKAIEHFERVKELDSTDEFSVDEHLLPLRRAVSGRM